MYCKIPFIYSLEKVNLVYYDVTEVAGCMRLEVGEGIVWDVVQGNFLR